MNLKLINQFFYLIGFFMLIGCGGSATNNDELFEPVLSNKAELFNIEFVYKNSVFTTSVSGLNIELDRKLPNGIFEVSIKSLKISSKATCNVKIGQLFKLNENPATISITAEDGTKQTYTVIYSENNSTSIVEENGNLQVNGNRIVNKNNEAVSFAGNSFFWSNDGWGGYRFYNASTVSWLKLDWQTTIIRAAMGVQEDGGYLQNKTANKNRVITIVNAAISEGIYVIIDWHSHHAEDNTEEAVEFFKEMAQLYGEYDNVIYEIYNEPLDISWSGVIKPYAEKVIKAIREIDSDNLIVVGTPNWSQKVDEAAADPITEYSNIAYVLHFYSVYHQQWLRDVANRALNSGIALFVTEWGSVGYTKNDPETEKWMQWCAENKISHCNWAVNDKDEEWSIVKQGSNIGGNWSDDRLTEAGILSRSIIRNWEKN
jgi:uncharacterized glyoxalase superfamily protein PhnB